MRRAEAIAIVTLGGIFLPSLAFVPRFQMPPAQLSSSQRWVVPNTASPERNYCRDVSSQSRRRRKDALRMGNNIPDPEEIFEALMAGDLAGVEAYVDAGGDCSVRDAIGA